MQWNKNNPNQEHQFAVKNADFEQSRSEAYNVVVWRV
ncbi:MAG: hypothetical protein ACI9G1_004934 [Pirellulaceae bacterium]